MLAKCTGLRVSLVHEDLQGTMVLKALQDPRVYVHITTPMDQGRSAFLSVITRNRKAFQPNRVYM